MKSGKVLLYLGGKHEKKNIGSFAGRNDVHHFYGWMWGFREWHERTD